MRGALVHGLVAWSGGVHVNVFVFRWGSTHPHPLDKYQKVQRVVIVVQTVGRTRVVLVVQTAVRFCARYSFDPNSAHAHTVVQTTAATSRVAAAAQPSASP
eukprot:2906852-Prymnesium_polylepis.1